MTTIFKKKPATTKAKTEPDFNQLTGTEKMRRMLTTKTRRRSLQQIAADINDIAGERANRVLAKNIAANMAGPDVLPEVVASLAKATFNNLPASNVRIVSEAALQSFADGSDMLADPVKVALSEFLFDGYHVIDPATDQIKPTRAGEPVLSGIPPDRYRNPNPEIAAAYKALHEAIARNAAR
jgi:hypothetical protein